MQFNTLSAQTDVMHQHFATSEQFGLYFDPLKEPKSVPDISIKEPDRYLDRGKFNSNIDQGLVFKPQISAEPEEHLCKRG